MLARADTLSRLTVLDDKGTEVLLGSLWRDRPAVIALVRHFGWLFCREQVVQLHRVIDRVHAAGAELHVIGNGAPMFIAGFRETTKFPGPIYTDPSLRVYDAAELVRGLSTTFNPRVGLNALRALKGGFRQGRTQGDPNQQGGVLVVAPSGEIKFHYVSKVAGDHPDVERVVRSLG